MSDPDRGRFAALEGYAIVDTPPEEAFDRITRIISTALDTPVAFVTFLQEHRIWFKSTFGADIAECAREGAFCDVTVSQNSRLVVEDARLDERFAGNPFVLAPNGFRFYAGMPLRTRDGTSIGTLCTMDKRPRALSEHQLRVLDDMAALVVDELELRHATKIVLNDTERRFRDFASTTSDWFWELGSDLRFSYFSERFTEITGVPSEWLLGKNRQESGIKDSLGPAVWERHLDDLAARRPFRNLVHPRTKPNGETVWLSVSGVPHFNEAGEFLGYRGTGTDITQRKNTEDALLAAKEHAERADAAKTEFVANMSHELRTPLNAIIGFSDVMKNEVFGKIGNERYVDYANDINASGTHLLAIINDILDAAKLDTGEFSISIVDVDVRRLLRECEVMVTDRLTRAGLTLDLQVEETLDTVRADTLRLRQVLLNLMTNAIKFTPASGRISVTVERSNSNNVEFIVTDTGRGIAKEDIARILEPFTQVSMPDSDQFEGTGLGLYLAKHLVEKHGGSLNIESEPNVGTAVKFSLPSVNIDAA